MKILFLINQFADGGRERRMVELVKGLDKIGDIQMHTIVFHKNVDYPDVLSTEMTYECIDDSDRKERCAKIEKVIASFAPDFVHSWVDTPTEMLLLAHLKNKYHYKYIAGFVADGNKDPMFSARHLMMMYTFWKSDAIVSNSIAGLIAKGAPKKKSNVIYNGFDFIRIPKYLDKDVKRKELGVKTRYLVVMCARINAAKDWESYIQLAAFAKEAELDVTFLAVGYGDKLSYYQEITNQLESNIKFIGRRTDVEEILYVADFGVLFTNSRVHAEGVSNFILETMASGIPVIATDGGGTPEIVESGQNGYIIKESDSKATFDCLKRAIDDKNLYTKLSKNAIVTISNKFSIEKMVNEYIDLYYRLLQK